MRFSEALKARTHILPGEALVRQGLMDVRSGRRSIPSRLAGIASPRLRCLYLLPASNSPSLPEPELQLYQFLRQQGGDAYSRYNALLREVVSFEQALDRRSPL